MALRSLRGALLIWLIVPLAALVAFNAWASYTEARATADLITERTLLASARVIAEQVKATDGVIEALIPPSALEMFASQERDRVVYRITGPDGELIAGYPDVIAPAEPLDGLQPRYFDAQFRTSPIRAVAIAQPVVLGGKTTSALVVVGETMRGHDQLLSDLWLSTLRDQVVLVAIAGLMAIFGLSRGLAPLLKLRAQVVDRNPANLQPLPTDALQSELQPLAQALNEAFARVQTYVDLQRRFIANAAHQLRTPLAILKTQAKVGLRDADRAAKDEALGAIDAGLDALNHLVNQLLTLARAEPGSAHVRKDVVDFHAIARVALERLTPQALERGIDLGFDAVDAPAPIYGHETLLGELVMNLVDNAIRHGAAGGVVTASLGRDGDRLTFSVEDNGPGIAEADRERVFERFYRVLGSGAEGSGLGLAIVREIVAVHDGDIGLAERVPPPGLVVRVTMPAALPPAQSSSPA